VVSIGARDEVIVGDELDLEGTLSDWRSFRRRRRVAEVHWIDALYRAYLTALVAGVLFLLAASLAGDGPATIGSISHADAAVGVVAAGIVFVGLRSGSRGGPLALEAADVRHVLLSPVDRREALRDPAVHQLRFLLFAGAVAGAAAGNLADRRLEGNAAEWLVCGALAAASTVALAHGLACCVAGSRLRPAVVTVLATALVAWSIADAAGELPWGPASAVGAIALWPIRWDPVGLVALVVAVLAAVAGLWLVSGTSLERLERRSRLVGQIRFAATLQDLRTVIVLRRQLTQERSRTRPWLRPPLPARRLPVVVRDVRSVLRWPAVRIARLGVVAVIAGLAARSAYDGTSAMVVVAGVALFVGGLDAAEPLGQEVDHPSRRDAVPVPPGWLYLRHLPMVVVVSVGLAAAAAVVAVLSDPTDGAWPVGLACVIPAALGAASGAAVNVLMGAPDPAGSASGAWAIAPPEAAGMRLLFRLVWPPALATFGVLPVLVARAAAEAGRPPAEAALSGIGPGIGVFLLVAAWARYRQDVARWWATQMEQAMPSKRPAGSTGG
jgi:hypothetical protein